MEGKVKLYIWEGGGVLSDYSNGMIFALGNDLKEALLAVEKTSAHCMQSFPNHKPTKILDLSKPIEPEAWVVWGGG